MISKMNYSENRTANKISLTLINSFLILGIATLIFTLLYVLFHLDVSDKIIYRCIPGFAFGLSSVILYGIMSNKKARERRTFHLKNRVRY